VVAAISRFSVFSLFGVLTPKGEKDSYLQFFISCVMDKNLFNIGL